MADLIKVQSVGRVRKEVRDRTVHMFTEIPRAQ
jgi:hypothetical protein